MANAAMPSSAHAAERAETSAGMRVASEILVIDGVVLWDFDYIDLGRIRLPSNTVPVTVKSLVFKSDPRLPHGRHHHHGDHAHHHDHDHDHHHDHDQDHDPHHSHET